MVLSGKLKMIRTRERLTQMEMATAVDLSVGVYKNYELGLRKEVSSLALMKITAHPRFKKYALWLVTDETAPECGQISPIIGQ